MKSPLHKKLDKIINKVYSSSQTPRSFVVAVARRLPKGLQGIFQAVPFSISTLPFGRRSTDVKTFQNLDYRGRTFATLATLLLAAALAACGGGGSGGTTVPPPVTPTPVDAKMTASVTPADGATSVARDTKLVATFSVTSGTYASSTATLSCNGTSSVLAQTTDTAKGLVTFTPATVLPYGSTCIGTVFLTAHGVDGGAQVNVNKTVTFSTEQLVCPAGEEPAVNGQSCVAQVLRYTDKVYALWTDKYPYAVTRTGVTKVKNMTQWNGLGKDLFLCFIANHPLADGKILTLCKDLAGLKWHLLYIDPTKDELREYSATPPADLVYVVSPEGGILAAGLGTSWLDVDKPTTAHPQWNSFAKVSDGYYFVEAFSSGGTIKFIGNDGVVSIVADRDPLVNGNGTIQVMWGYNN